MHAHHKTGKPASLEEKKKILTKAIIRMAEHLMLSRHELSAILGPSEASLSRMFTKPDYFLDPESKEGQLSLLLLRIYRSLDALFGGNTQQCQLWLRSENSHLHGIPINLIQTIEGLVLVTQYLDAMRGKN